MLSLIYWLWILLSCLVITLLSAIAWVVCYPFDKRRTVVHALSRCLVWCIHGVPFLTRHRIEGLEKLDPKRAYVIMANHNSMFDITSMYYLPLNFRWVTKREVMKTPFFGQLILDCLNRTENAMTQAHAFKAAELCLQAEAQALKIK